MNRAVRHFVRHRTCRLSQSNLPDRTKYTFDANDRLLTERLDTTGDGIAEQLTTYGYTGTQQTSKAVYTGDQPTLGNETSQVTYDLQGRMETVVTETWSGGNLTRREQVTYDYDAQGIRVSAGHKTDTDGNGTDLTRATLSGKGRGHPRLDSTGSIAR